MILQTEAIGTWKLLRLVDPGTGQQVTVLPKRGVTINDLQLLSRGVPLSVLQPMRTSTEIDGFRWFKGGNLAPFPNRIRGGVYSFGGKEYHLPINFRPKGGHAIHGFLQNVEFALVEQDLKPARGRLLFRRDQPKGWTGYPFGLHVEIELVLHRTEGLTHEIRVTNIGSSAAPVGVGWHPYFRLPGRADNWTLKLPDSRRLELDQQQIPTGQFLSAGPWTRKRLLGESFLDDGFQLEPADRHETTLSAEGRTLKVWQKGGKGGYNYLQVFTPPQRHGVAVEPMTCAPDAFNNGLGLVKLAPGKTLTATCGVSLEG